MNRAERRRAKREERTGSASFNTMLTDTVSQAIRDKLMEKRALDRAILATSGPMLESVYAAIVILMTEDYGFTHDQCVELLQKLEDKTLYCMDHMDILNEAFEKTGIKIHFNDAIDRIEESTT